MVKMGMKDQEFGNPPFVNVEIGHLLKEIRHDVAHAATDDHGFPPSLKKIDPCFLATQKTIALLTLPGFRILTAYSASSFLSND